MTRAAGRGRPLLLRCAWPLPRLLAELLALAFVAWEGVQGRYSTASHAGILAVVAIVVLLALVCGRGRQRKPTRAWVRDAARALAGTVAAGRTGTATAAGAAVWTLLIAATIGWDANSFSRQSRDLPTLSRLFGDVTGHDWGRALVFAAWLVLGLYLALGWRLPAAPPDAHVRHPGDRAGAPLSRCPPREKDAG